MEFWQWLNEACVSFASDEARHQRFGQWLFNHLHGVRPDIANALRGEWELDPFYSDQYVDAFVAYVEEMW
jgi:hypothetical protein